MRRSAASFRPATAVPALHAVEHRRLRPQRPAIPWSRWALAAWAACGGVNAAQAAETDLDGVIVTGTRSKDRTVLTSTAPIDVLSRDDLQRAAGADGTLAAALQTLLPSFNFPRQSVSGGADHVRAAQLRGLSPDQVLVLINGKRRSTTAMVNLESKTGKGTNPVDFNSIPLNAIKRIEVLRDGAGAQYGSDAIAGVVNVILDDASSGSEISLETGAFHTKFAPTGETITDGQTQTLAARSGIALGDRGVLRYGAEYARHRPTNRAGFDDVGSQVDFGFLEGTPANLATNGQRNYKAGEPDAEQVDLWANGRLELGPDLGAYGFATYARRRSAGGAYFRYPDSAANVASVYPNGYRPQTTGLNQDLQLVGGVRATLGGLWDVDASLGWGRNHFDYGVEQSLNASLGAASPTRFDLGTFQFDQLTANLDATRELDLGLAKPATLALGAELRQERYVTEAGDPASYQAGPFESGPYGLIPTGAQAGPGLQAADAVNRRRRAAGVYAELSADLTPSFYGSAAIRHDRYSDFGSATTGKLSGRYAVTPDIGLRAAASTNYRAPALAQTAFAFTVTDRGGDDGQLVDVKLVPVDDPLARRVNAPALEAEQSRNLSAGVTAKLAPNVSLTVDAYQIDVDGRITLSQRFDAPGGGAFNFFNNAVDTRTRGVDLVLNGLTPWAGGDLRWTLASAYLRNTIRHVDRTYVGLEEINTLTTASPRNRHIATLQWTDPRWALLARLTRHGSTTRVFDFGDGFTPTQRYAAVWQLDLEAEWKLNRTFALALGGVNVADRYPTRSEYDISYFQNFPYDTLSPIGLNGAYWYARLRASF